MSGDRGVRQKVKEFVGSKGEVFSKYLELLNVILPNPLTKLERDIVVLFFVLGGINKETKKEVRRLYKFYTYSSLDNYIVSIKKKGIIVGDYSKVRINPNIMIEEGEDFEILFKFKIK